MKREHTLNRLKKSLTVLMTAAFLSALLPIGAKAADVTAPYVDENGAAHSATATEITPATTTLPTGWYIVDSNVSTTDLVVNGDVKLILADGATLNANASNGSASIRVNASNSLTVYSQAAGTGRLIANGGANGAGLGGDSHNITCGTITIAGGTIIAIGNSNSAGIGGGSGGSGGIVTVTGGLVNATGGASGAGIGGSGAGNGGTFSMSGGSVTAAGGANGSAGIGGGGSGLSGGDGGTVTISGGTVSAIGGAIGGAGIGGSSEGAGGTVTITGGTVKATGANSASAIGHGAYGTGGTLKNGSGTDVFLTTVTLSDVASATAVQSLTTTAGYTYGTKDMATDASGKLYLYLPAGTETSAAIAGTATYSGSVTTTTNTATSLGTLLETVSNASYVDENGVAHSASAKVLNNAMTALTSGWYIVSRNTTTTDLGISGDVKLILANGATLTANGSYNHAGVCVTSGNSLTIYGQAGGTGKLQAQSGIGGAGIGGDGNASGTRGMSCGTLTLNGGIIDATGNSIGAGIGGGTTTNGGVVTINGGIVTAIGGAYGAGIGGSSFGNGGTVTITGGTISTTGGSNGAAGIGGGSDGGGGGAGGTVTITGGTISATGGTGGGAGIGGGKGAGSGGIVTITGGSIKATGTNGSANIGPGSGGTLTNGSASVYLTTVVLNGVASSTAVQSLTTNAGYAYGTRGMATDASGKLYLYLPVSALTSAALAAGTLYAGGVTTTTSAATSIGALSPVVTDLMLSLNDGVASATTGGAVTYTLSVFNGSPVTITNASVTCNLPAALTGVTWTSSGSGGGTGTSAGSGNIADLVTLPASGSVTYTINATLDNSASGTLTTTATITPPYGASDLNPGNNTATDSDTIISHDATLSGLTLSQGTLSPVFSGSTASYTASVANSFTSLTVTPTVHDSGATVTVNGTAVTSGSASGTIALAVGTNTITVRVTAQDGTTTQDYTVTATRAASASSAAPATASYTATFSGGPALPITLSTGGTGASVALTDEVSSIITSGKAVTIKLPTIPGVTSYSVGLPVATLKTPGGGALTFSTDTGSMTLPADMLSGVQGAEGKKAEITIGLGTLTGLPDSAKAAVGNHPLIGLSLSLDGVQTAWNNPNAPVSIAIPYKPTAEELKNPDSIVIWYIDGSGKLTCVPSGHYDATSGTVRFETTHFSLYAVGYSTTPTFSDVAAGAWYRQAVAFLAARGIATGSGGLYQPEKALTRGEFLVMLLRAYGIAPDTAPTDNFSDGGDTYYTGYLATAKRLGLSSGIGDNLFAPQREISRQEMFTLLYNTLSRLGQLPQGQSGKTLSDFSDVGDIAPWAEKALSALVESGAITGSSGHLSPSATTTRGELSQVIYRLLAK